MMPLHPIGYARFAARLSALAFIFITGSSVPFASAAPPVAAAHGGIVTGTAGWTQEAKLLADVAASNDYAGRAVALDGDTAVVGAAGADVGGNDGQGAAFVYVIDGGWNHQSKLADSDEIVRA
jgi:hypothetical protein